MIDHVDIEPHDRIPTLVEALRPKGLAYISGVTRKLALYCIEVEAGEWWEYPVPLEEMADSVFPAVDRRGLFQHWIRRAIEGGDLIRCPPPKGVAVRNQDTPEVALDSVVVKPVEDIDTAALRMSPSEFATGGFLQEVNRMFLHPLGLALEIRIGITGTVEDGYTYHDIDGIAPWFVGSILDYRESGVRFDPALLSIEKAKAVHAIWKDNGKTIQQLEGDDDA